MSCIANLLRLADAYQKATGLDLSTVSWRALGDVRKLSALAAGKDIQVTRFERAMEWFSQNWPEDAEWPDGVPRAALVVAVDDALGPPRHVSVSRSVLPAGSLR